MTSPGPRHRFQPTGADHGESRRAGVHPLPCVAAFCGTQNPTFHAMQLTLPSSRLQRFATATLLALVPAAAASAQTSTVEAGYQLGPSASFTDLCADGPAYASFLDGSYIVFDGYDVEHRGASGSLIRRYAAFPFYTFPSFMTLNAAGTKAYFGESSNGEVYELDLVSGQLNPIANLTFNFDMALHEAGGVGYISAATGGFGFNALHRVDLNTLATTQVASVSGFSGPVTVDGAGDVLMGLMPDTFPFPDDSVSVLRFAAADLATGNVLQEANATVEVANLDGLSSLAYDATANQLLLMETNSGASGFDTVMWKQRSAGSALEQVAEAAGYAGGLQIQDAGIGTAFGAYQPNYVAVTFNENDCYGTGSLTRVEVRGLRPVATFDGPSLGGSGQASFSITGGPANGFASLWIARSGALETNDIITPMGAALPIALRADMIDFGRRVSMIPLDAQGEVSLSYFQDVTIEGAMMAQFLVFDANGSLLTTSNYVINRSNF